MRFFKKREKILVLILVILGIGLITFGITINFQSGMLNDDNDSTSEKENSKPNLTDEEEGKLVSNLIEYGISMYEDGSYLQFNELDDSYYITLGELKTKGYSDVEKMVYDCTDDDPIIYFYKNVEEFEFYPIVVSYYCGGYEPKE